MGESIGLDVSLKETAISVRRDGKRIWRGKCPSDPSLIAEVVRKRAPEPQRVVFETGPLSVWFYHALQAEGLPAICIDARHAKAALDMAPNKTDANDADGLAHLAEVGFYRAVRVKSYDSMLVRTLVAARSRLVQITTELSNQIRGLMKTFGLVVPRGKGGTFEAEVQRLLVGQDGTRPDHPADAGGLAQRAQPGIGPGAPASGLRPAECGLSAVNGDPRGGGDHRHLVHGRHRGSCQLQDVALGRRLAGPDDPPLSVRGGRL